MLPGLNGIRIRRPPSNLVNLCRTIVSLRHRHQPPSPSPTRRSSASVVVVDGAPPPSQCFRLLWRRSVFQRLKLLRFKQELCSCCVLVVEEEEGRAKDSGDTGGLCFHCVAGRMKGAPPSPTGSGSMSASGSAAPGPPRHRHRKRSSTDESSRVILSILHLIILSSKDRAKFSSEVLFRVLR